ncbi:hypothetical protein BU17DRAFT_77646 [Hysterangium stoloniferum]|nr:hypothetical protein BU17DRAFT_77646 [Hysterangium stoloniferum]
MPQKKQYKPRPPDESIQEPLRQYYELGLSDVKITELLKERYDTNNYGLRYVGPFMSLKSHRWLCSYSWGMLSTRQQNHTPETIYNTIYEIQKRFPLCGIEGICKSLRIEHDICASRMVESDEVKQHRRCGFHRCRLWAAGINDVWPQDQHDKWGPFGLWLHAGIEAFSSEINWLKVWWTNKNPRLIVKYYLDTCWVPIITQRHNNILSEIKWSIFQRDFSPVDCWVSLKNKLAPHASRHKLLPHGIPALIHANLSHFSAIDFKIPMEARYAPPDHPVFELVPQVFHEHFSDLYSAIKTFWDFFRNLLGHLCKGPNEWLTEIITHHNTTYGQELDNMPLLPNMEAF